MPLSHGGDVAMLEFISKNIVIPKETSDYLYFNVAVYKEYIVEKDGTTSGHKIVYQYCRANEREIVRICNLIRCQKPGRQEDLPVRGKIRLPIRIHL
jgi:hypothetical protein